MFSNLQHEANDLRKFFWPQGIAVVGASADPAKPGGRVVQLLKGYRYPGQIYPVNPGRRAVQGLPAYGALAEIEAKPDLAIIALEAARVPAAARECAALQIKNLVVISGGFAEVGGAGAALQEELAEVAAKHNLTILGPNCIGFINTLQPAVASFSLTVESGAPRPGPAAFVAQSGGLGILAVFLADLEKFGFSYVISTGNEISLDFASVLNFLVREPRVRVIGGYLEGVSDGSGLRRSCRAAAEAGKPLLMLKAGISREAAAAIRSHTGALAGSGEAYRAFFRQEGVLEVETLTEMLSFFKAFLPGRFPRGNRAALLSLSGGMGVLAADLCAAAGLELARFSPETLRELRRLIPTIATVRNPLDPTAAILARLPEVRRVIEIILADPGVDLFIFTTAIWRASGAESGRMMAELFAQTEKPFFVIWPGCGRESKEIILDHGVPFFSELKEGIGAAAATWRYALFQKNRSARVSHGDGDFDPASGRGDDSFGPQGDRPRRFLSTATGSGSDEKSRQDVSPMQRRRGRVLSRMPAGRGGSLSEEEAKRILACWGIDIPRGEVVEEPEQAVAAAGRIGYPVVLKAISPEIAHKTEAGAVKLDLRDAAALRGAWEQIRRSPALRVAGGKRERCLVEEMLPVRLEMIAGVRADPVFGPLLLLGFGGIHVEIFRDLAMRFVPLEPAQVREMLDELKGAPLLGGFRGAPPVDSASLVEAVTRFSDLAAALRGSYRELEINPLVICADGRAVAADALFLL